CFGSLERSAASGQAPEHTALCTARYQGWRRRLPEQTAITWAVCRAKHRGLSLESIHASINVGDSEQHRDIVYQIACREVVGPIDDQIVAARDLEGVARHEARIVGFDVDVRIDVPNSVARGVELRAPHGGRAVQNLPLQV